ncbi:glycosyl transferase group 1 [Salinisphaera sp. C84B14]
MQRHRVDVFITRAYEIVPLAVDAGLPVILEQHEDPSSPQMRAIEDYVHRDDFLGLSTISETLKEGYVSTSGLPESKVFVFPDGVSLDRVRREPLSRSAARDMLSIPKDVFTVAYVGSLFEYKGITSLLDAAAELPNVNFLIIGDRPFGQVEVLRNRYREYTNVMFLGHMPNGQVPAYLDAVDCCVLPNSAKHLSARYTSPLKLFEYMASRRPIIATRIEALDGLLEHERNAYLVPPDSAGDLSRAIETVRISPILASRMASNAFDDVVQLTWDCRAKALCEFYGL